MGGCHLCRSIGQGAQDALCRWPEEGDQIAFGRPVRRLQHHRRPVVDRPCQFIAPVVTMANEHAGCSLGLGSALISRRAVAALRQCGCLAGGDATAGPPPENLEIQHANVP
jgi:hypothetical protein